MSWDEVYELVVEYLVATYGIPRPHVTPETRLDSMGSFDSLNVVELVMHFEEELQVHVDDVPGKPPITVRDLVDLLHRG
jgi:acyl carrier protein